MRRLVCLLLAGWIGVVAVANADVFPSHSIRLVVPYSTGGGSDFFARLISQQLSEQMGVAIVVENRPGGGGTAGSEFVAKSPPDGYTLMLMDTSTTIAPGLKKSLPFDVAKDFTPIVQLSAAPLVLAISPGLKSTTLQEFIALARANPGKLNYASAGSGTLPHLAPELFKTAASVDIVHIPYKGGGEMVTALLSDQVQMVLVTIPTTLTHINSGKMRALAVTTAENRRAAILPGVPSMNEAGLPNLAIYQWYGLVGPAGLPKEVVDKLYAETVKALAVPSIREKFLAQGNEIVGANQADFAKQIRVDLDRWAQVIKTAGVQVE